MAKKPQQLAKLRNSVPSHFSEDPLNDAVAPIPRRTILKELPSGVIAIEVGGDGIFLRFDCDCLDALPYCHAACCALSGTTVNQSEADALKAQYAAVNEGLPLTVFDPNAGSLHMARRADTFCRQNDQETHRCKVYEDRPFTCRQFHCTRLPDTRGWRLTLHRIEP